MTTSIGSGDVVGMEEAIIALDLFEQEAHSNRGQIANYYTARLGEGSRSSSAFQNDMRACRERVHAIAIQVMSTCRFQDQNVRNYVQTRLQNIENIYV